LDKLLGNGHFVKTKGIAFMIFAINLSISLLLLIFSVVKLQKLHLFEIIFIWVIVTFLHQNFTAIASLNLDLWKKPEQTNQLLGLLIADLIGIPVIVIWLFELYVKYDSPLARSALFLLFTSLLVGVDYLMDYVNLVHFIFWSPWNSFALWFVILTISLLLLLCYRAVLRKEALP
jgi:hypothetical protein